MDFQIKGEYIELIKLLKLVNVAESGAQAKMMVDDGIVTVNGDRELRRRKKLRPGDRVEVEGQTVQITA